MNRRVSYCAYLIIIGLVFNLFADAQDSLIISEFMAINNDDLEDEDSDNSDWIELFNADTADINLVGWFLTDDSADLTKWAFPSVVIDSGEYLVIFASGKNRKLEKDKLHTNFKLSGSGEFLSLVKPGGTEFATVFRPAFPEQISDVHLDFWVMNTPGYRLPPPEQKTQMLN